MTQLHARVEVVDYGPGYDRYQVSWWDGLRTVARDTLHPTPRRAIDRANEIDPPPTTRSAPETPAGTVLGTDAAVTPGSSESPDATCSGCGGPLPPGRRGQSPKTCSLACRVAAHRRSGENGPRPARRGAGRSVTPSRGALIEG